MEESEKIAELEQLVSLLPNRGEWEKKSFVLRPKIDRPILMETWRKPTPGVEGSYWVASDPVPQSFFHDEELIAAVQEAQVAGVDKREAAEKIRRRMSALGAQIENLGYHESYNGYDTGVQSLEAFIRARQMEKYLSDFNDTNPPDPNAYLSEKVIRDLLDQAVIDLFEVEEVTGPAVVTLRVDYEYGEFWGVTQLRQELIKLMSRMTSK